MNTLRLIYLELLHRKLNAFLGLVGIITAVSLSVAFFTTGQAATRETTRLMRDIGFNLRVIPRQTDMERFWATGHSTHTMPEEYVHRLATHEGLSYAHMSATLQWRLTWQGRDVLVTGMAPELDPPGKQHTPMHFAVEPGTAYLGAAIAGGLDLQRGDSIDLNGQALTVARVLTPTGTIDDIRVYTHLRDAQAALGLESRINEIKALECLCLVDGVNVDSVAVLEQQLATTLPQAKLVRITSIAQARQQQRIMAERFFAFVMPLMVVVCMLWIGVVALLNVRERVLEIGVMRALGFGSVRLAGLFLGRALGLGLAGALLGYAIGTALALHYGPAIFRVTANSIRPSFGLLLTALWVAPAFSGLAAFIPTMWGVAQDPALILREG